ncbi:hypothetical protein [Peterkaempfera bronchialis]|uniref:hypothetical protein n=1 Tax=Peterkaempfera bronchialis TaxID=2126346 RepID=UPI003C2FDFE7
MDHAMLVPAPVLQLPVDAPTLDRLHGDACINCGTEDGPLLPAGHAYTADGEGQLGWPVAACPDHQGAAR